MKKLFTLLTFFVFILKANAQNTFPASGNVGIGTSSPSADLHLSKTNGNTNLLIENISSITDAYPGMNINNYQGSTLGHPYIMFNNAKGTKSSPTAIGGTLLGALIFSGHNGINFIQSARMEVFAEAPFTATNTPTNITFSTTSINTNSISEKMRITSNGNVGIGNTSPNAKLDIRTSLPAQGAYDVQYWSTDNTTYSLRLQQVWDSNGIGQRFIQKFNGVDYTALSFLNGKVGIGTTAPGSYKLAVAGSIGAWGEVRVFTAGASFPDYVFDPSYQLPSLEETEKYVKENHHLPEVPSAADIEKDGMSLNGMNTILLKKVEELTLYMIEMKKENEIMKKEIKELKENQKK